MSRRKSEQELVPILHQDGLISRGPSLAEPLAFSEVNISDPVESDEPRLDFTSISFNRNPFEEAEYSQSNSEVRSPVESLGSVSRRPERGLQHAGKSDNFKAKLRHMFDMFDSDKSGTLDLNEVRGAMQALGFGQTEEEFMDTFSTMDRDNSGEVTLAEFERWMSNENSHRERSMKEEIESCFKFLADHRSGKISMVSLKKVSQRLGLDFDSDQLLNMVQMADPDVDAEVDLEEFTALALKTNVFA